MAAGSSDDQYLHPMCLPSDHHLKHDREHLRRRFERALVRRSFDHDEAAFRDGRSLTPPFHAEEFGGTGHLTLREAARRASVSHSAPYRHFPDKQAILASVAAEGFTKLSDALREARAGVADREERFIGTGLAYLRFARERRGYLAVMFGPEVAKSQTPELQQRANDAFTVLQEMAADARAIDGAQARRLGTVIWSLVHGLATLTGQGQVPSSVNETPEGLATLGLTCLFRSFRARRSRTPIATSNPRTSHPAR